MMGQQRRKKGRPISGWIALDKPFGMGSTQCVSKMKWLYKAAKCGHAGTLDPLASGMLPIALGEATRTVPYVMDGEKQYRFEVSWGMETNTDDLEGEAVQTSLERPAKEAITAILERFTGEIEQVPPAFSAVRINGERAYKRARDGENVDIPARRVWVENLRLEEANEESAVFVVDCGKGTYVRSIARDMGRMLGCFAHVSALRRTRVGPFHSEDMVTMDQLVEYEDDLERLDGELFTTATALEDMLEVSIGREQVSKLRLGNAVVLRGRDSVANADEAFASFGNELVAIGKVGQGQFKPSRVFSHSFI